MNLCRTCDFKGLCVVRSKLIEDTVLEFPDGKIAIVSMEESMVSCEHYSGNEEFEEVRPARAPKAKAAPARKTARSPEPEPTGEDLYEDEVVELPAYVPPVEIVEESEPVASAAPAFVLPQQQQGVAVPYTNDGPVSRMGTRKLKLNLSSMGG